MTVDEVAEPPEQGLEAGTKFPQILLNIGFIFSIVLSSACLILSTIYLYQFLNTTNSGINQLIEKIRPDSPSGALEVAINGRLVMARVALLSCGVFTGMSFGFLGFALFLLGIRKEINADAQYENFQVKLARMSPGVFIILIAAILIGVCVTHSTPFTYETIKIPIKPTTDSNRETKTLPRAEDLNP